jgi:hypothetical protein
MTAPTSGKSAKQAPSTKGPAWFDDSFKLYEIDLVSTELRRLPSVTGSETEAEPTITCEVDTFTSIGELHIVFTNFRVERKAGNNPGEAVDARYVLAFLTKQEHPAESDLRSATEIFIKTAAWQRFRDLLGFVAIQSDRLSIPKAKLAPEKIEWKASIHTETK